MTTLEVSDEMPDGPQPLRKGDWVVCANDHRNWRCLRDIGPEGPRAADFVNAQGDSPQPGTSVGNCWACGEPLVVRGNQGNAFRVQRPGAQPHPYEAALDALFASNPDKVALAADGHADSYLWLVSTGHKGTLGRATMLDITRLVETRLTAHRKKAAENETHH